MSPPRLPARGLYAITDSSLHTGSGLERAVARAIDGGARVIQYRDKGDDRERRHDEASRLVRLCRSRQVPLIVNDDADLALRIEADGVHIGRDDEALVAVRERVGGDLIVGVSCYDDPERAVLAERLGADYVAFGAMFPSGTKPGATPAGIDTVVAARRRIRLPIAAIGGITPDNAASLLDAGVDMLAVVRGVFGHDDPAVPARRFRDLFETLPEDEEA